MQIDAVTKEDSILNKYLASVLQILFENRLNPFMKVSILYLKSQGLSYKQLNCVYLLVSTVETKRSEGFSPYGKSYP